MNQYYIIYERDEECGYVALPRRLSRVVLCVEKLYKKHIKISA